MSINAANSKVPLTADFTGTTTDVSKYSSATVSVKANVAGTVTVRQSPDGTSWIIQDTIAVAADTFIEKTFTLNLKFFSVVWAKTGATNPNTTSNLVTKFNKEPVDAVSRGLSTYHSNSLANKTAIVEDGGTQLYWLSAFATGADGFVQLFDATSAGVVTLGTTAPKLEFAVKSDTIEDHTFSHGVAFDLGLIGAGTTTTHGTVTASANTLHINIGYK
jgi:hypothetical protein